MGTASPTMPRLALVTGASVGIGQAFAERLARVNIVVADLTQYAKRTPVAR